MSIQHLLSILFDSEIQKLNSSFSEVNSSPASEPLFGYVHLLDQGNAILITDDRKPYLITVEFAVYFHLKTGDRVQARISFNPTTCTHVVCQIIEVKHVAYDEAPLIKADQSFDLCGTTINLGTSIMIPVTDNNDIATKTACITGVLPNHVVPMLLSFDGRSTNFNVTNACFTKPNYSSREKLMTCLLAFFQAKQQADIGKDVVLIIDSFDKMFFAFNNCMQTAGTIDPNLFSTAAVMDYENILCSSGNLKAGGSLTLIGFHQPGNSPQMLQITDRLHQIMDRIIEIK